MDDVFTFPLTLLAMVMACAAAACLCRAAPFCTLEKRLGRDLTQLKLPIHISTKKNLGCHKRKTDRAVRLFSQTLFPPRSIDGLSE